MKREDRIVEKLRGLIPPSDWVVLGPGDDAAVVLPRPGELVVTTDLLIEGVDFLPDEEPERLGRRALAVNLSDLAAMGARPEFFLLSIGFPAEDGEEFPLAVARGAISQAARFGATLVGGDLSRAPARLVSIALWGCAEARPIRRSGACTGDLLYVSGYPGRAAAGLRLARRLSTFASQGSRPTPRFVGLTPEHERELLAAYHDPEPRIALGLAFAREGLVHAAIDVSDGLGVDAGRLARASQVRAVIEEGALPISPALASFAEQEAVDPVEWMLSGGDDYELLLAAPESARAALKSVAATCGVVVTSIGRMESGEGAVLQSPRGDRDITELGHDHLDAAP